MSNTSIAQLLQMPDQAAFDSIQGTITEVYKQRNVKGDKTVQDAKLRDASGAEIKLSIWDHDDISVYKGREVIINAGPKGGLKVVLDTYRQPHTNTVSVSKMGTFQFLEVHRSNTGAAPASAPRPQPCNASGNASGPAPVVVNGAKVGMAINNACLFLQNSGSPFDSKQIHAIASEIIRLSNAMENGELLPYAAKEDVPY